MQMKQELHSSALTFVAEAPYLVFPVNSLAKKKRLCFWIDGKLVYDLLFPLDYVHPAFECPLDIRRFQGKTVCITCDQDMPLRLDQREEAACSYDGNYRPYAHFTAKRGWLNDPNGLVLAEGRYHMFFQYNPVDCQWENMHWGHAVSADLVHWEEKEITFFPDENGTIFSGSAIIDRRNVTGLKQNEHDVILVYYTCAGSTSEASKGKPFTQNLAYSTDGGVTFQRYAGNPLIPQLVGGNRDPKVIYYEPDNSYILALYLDNHEYALYKSQNLLDWQMIQRLVLPEDAECPDFFPLPVDGDASHVKWVFIGASDRYYIGSFDGERFTAESDLLRLNYGSSSYAAQSWSDVPGRRIRTAFSTVVAPGEPYASCMNLPQEMSLKTVHDGLRLCVEPAREIALLYDGEQRFAHMSLAPGQAWKHQVGSRCCDLTLSVPVESSFTLTLFGFEVNYDAANATLQCHSRQAPVHGENGRLTLRLVMDTVNTEVFADQGSVFMGMPYVQDDNLNTLILVAEAGMEKVDLRIAELHPFWKRAT